VISAALFKGIHASSDAEYASVAAVLRRRDTG
jgi:hypothetical protein